MKAVCWHGQRDVRVDTVPDPEILDSRDVIIKVTSSGICGSDLHLYNNFMPTMESGDILGHEPMGEVVEKGSAIHNLSIGDRVVVPFTISCGDCFFCEHTLFSLCDNSNPNADKAAKVMGQSPAGIFGYSHLLGGFSGGQAEYLRVPYADVGPLKIPDGVEDEQVVFLSDIIPTGYMAAENAEISKGDTVAVWGCGPVGQFTIQSAWLLGAGRVIAIDTIPDRLEMARQQGRAEVINFEEQDVYETIMSLTQGRGADRCIDAVGCEAHSSSTVIESLHTLRHSLHLQENRPYVLNEAVRSCRKGGTLSIPGVYTSTIDKFLFSAAMNKGLTLRMGQTHVQRYLQPLLEMILEGKLNSTFVLSHIIDLAEAPEAYERFNKREEGCMKFVIRP